MITPILVTSVLAGATVLAQSQAPSLKASMIVLGVADVSRAAKFYRDTLGLPPHRHREICRCSAPASSRSY